MVEEQTTVNENSAELTIESFKDSHFLGGKNAGCSLSLRGKVVFVNMLVSDGDSEWDGASIEEYVAMLKELTTEMMLESRLNKEQLQIAYAYCHVKVPYPVERNNISQCITDTLRQFGEYKTVQEYQEHYQNKFSRNEAVIIFSFNKNFRSYAQKVAIDGFRPDVGKEIGEEYSIVSFAKGDAYSSKHTLKHEILHQFGAIDYYYPQYLKDVSENMFPGSVMNDGNTIDDFTRYLIGWDEEPTESALKFLDRIKNVSRSDIEYARRMEWIEK